MFGFLKSTFKKFSSSLSKISIGSKIRELFSSKSEWDEETFEKLEQLLYESDLGVTCATELTEKVKIFIKKKQIHDQEAILKEIKQELLPLFQKPTIKEQLSPHVILIVGVNGSGKTTSLAKLAYFYQNQGKKVLIAAADTYRAAALEQLSRWVETLKDITLVKSQSQSDPSAVVFDALQAAKARGSDIVLIDTAGRLHTKKDLMQELEKIKRVCQKVVKDSPHEILLTLDATIGQNALDQIETFHQTTPISGIILTKLDGSAKGGIVVAIQKKFQIPIEWIGTGESLQDFVPFDPESFLNALLGLQS